MTEDEMVGWHHWLNGHEFEQAPGVGDGLGSLASCIPWGRKESDMTEWLNWTERKERKVKSLSHVQLFGTPWTVAYQVPPSKGFSRQEYLSTFPSLGNLPDPGIEPGSPALQADALLSELPGKLNWTDSHIWAATKYWAVVNSVFFLPSLLPFLPSFSLFLFSFLPSFLLSFFILSFSLSSFLLSFLPSPFLFLLEVVWVNNSETTFSVY